MKWRHPHSRWVPNAINRIRKIPHRSTSSRHSHTETPFPGNSRFCKLMTETNHRSGCWVKEATCGFRMHRFPVPEQQSPGCKLCLASLSQVFTSSLLLPLGRPPRLTVWPEAYTSDLFWPPAYKTECKESFLLLILAGTPSSIVMKLTASVSRLGGGVSFLGSINSALLLEFFPNAKVLRLGRTHSF